MLNRYTLFEPLEELYAFFDPCQVFLMLENQINKRTLYRRESLMLSRRYELSCQLEGMGVTGIHLGCPPIDVSGPLIEHDDVG
jgi:hypothetical protein